MTTVRQMTGSASRKARHRRAGAQRGVTLVELMVVLTIVGVLMAAAVVSYQNSPASVHGYAEQVSGELDGARLRAVASKRWQRVEIQAAQVSVWEATTEGMATPVGWQLLRTVFAPAKVSVVSMSDQTHAVPNSSVPAPGAGMTNAAVEFRPDGAAAAAATIFIGDARDVSHVRVAVYRATGSAYVFNDW